MLVRRQLRTAFAVRTKGRQPVLRISRPVLVLPRSLATTVALRDWQAELRQLQLEEEQVEQQYPETSQNPPSRQIFVGNLPSKATEEDVYDTFAAFGAIRSVLLIEKPDGSSRGFGYVTFVGKQAARAALSARPQLFQQLLHVDYVDPRPRQIRRPPTSGSSLFLRSLPAAATEADLHEQFRYFGDVASIRITGTSAEVTFIREEDAIAAHEEFAAEPLYIHHRRIVVGYTPPPSTPSPPKASPSAHTVPQPRGNSGNPPSCWIFVSNLPFEAKAPDIREFFTQFGAVRSVSLAENPNGSSRGFGYVMFAEQEAATAAVSSATLNMSQRALLVDYIAPNMHMRTPAEPSAHLLRATCLRAATKSIRPSKQGDFVHLEFMRQEDAVAAYEHFVRAPLYLRGHKIRIDYAAYERPTKHTLTPNRRLYFWDFGEGGDEAALRLLLADVEPAVTAIRFFRDPNTGMNNRAGFIEFKTIDDATQAIERFHGNTTPYGPLNLEYGKM
ncbi:hypothetical protein C8R43DRAFT_1026140 [Mycena crocata]|nr:hypothetical protein C8R43DRAFT_1026140 [Mycena crocata]